MNKFNIFPWQNEAWQQYRTLAVRMPHALLFYGQPGIGKALFARHIAQSQLCDMPDMGGHACNQCQSCRWFIQRSHPDFRQVRPEAVDVAEGLENAEMAEGDGETEKPESGDEKKSKRAPSKDIRIEQVRALADFLNIGTHRGGRRMVLLYPAHAMNVYTANALLKMLEEPPENTIFLLVADGLERILPTILSRCRKFPLAPPSTNDALEWLDQQGVADAAQLLAEQGGAPLAALQASTSQADLRALRDRLFTQLAAPGQMDPLATADLVAKCELVVVVGWLQRWVHDCLALRISGQIRYYPTHATQIAALAQAMLPLPILGYAKLLAAERRVAEHPLNARLYSENLLLAYRQACAEAMRHR